MEQPLEFGDWRQISVLGSGAFGTVMLWCNQKNSDFIAIKKCKFLKKNSLSQKQKDRWRQEVDFLKNINHRNIINFKPLDTILEDMINKYNPTKLPLLPMEYCRKGNLRRHLSSEPIKLCGLPEQDVRCILEDVSNGLNYLHSKNITHRDIKPDNIVLQHCDMRKSGTVYKIIDLGYAKELRDATLSFVGTLHYLAPEIFYNQDYNNSVDYWSVGTMVFEIICGVLPFLPELTPFERYEQIKDKGAEDICIYMSYSGSITKSREIKRENFITSCFKQAVEAWLKQVLQMDPSKRTFNNDLGAFDYMRFILDKKIIQVFSVYKQEFYSYEISDSTLFGTLKNWISRDIKVPAQELLFLVRNMENGKIWHCDDDNSILLENFIYNQEVILYVYKRDALFSDKRPTSRLPNLVCELFKINSNISVKHLRNVYRQALFYVYSDRHVISEFKSAYLTLIDHIINICDRIRIKQCLALRQFGLAVSNIKEFLEKKKVAVNHNENSELSECLKYFELLCPKIEVRESRLKDFTRQSKLLQNNRPAINKARQEIEEIFKKYDLGPLFDKMNGKIFLEKKNDETPESIFTRIKDVVSATMKLSYNLFYKERNLENYSKDLWRILKSSKQLLEWVDKFIINIQSISGEFNTMQEKYDKIVGEAVQTRKVEFVLSVDLEKSQNIIKENQLLRSQFAELLSETVSSHKNFVEASMQYLDLS